MFMQLEATAALTHRYLSLYLLYFKTHHDGISNQSLETFERPSLKRNTLPQMSRHRTECGPAGLLHPHVTPAA